jgi:hypothetical protein
MNTDREWLSVAEFCAYVGLTRRQAERLRFENRGPPYYVIPGLRPRYLREEVDAWLRAHRGGGK